MPDIKEYFNRLCSPHCRHSTEHVPFFFIPVAYIPSLFITCYTCPASVYAINTSGHHQCDHVKLNMHLGNLHQGCKCSPHADIEHTPAYLHPCSPHTDTEPTPAYLHQVYPCSPHPDS